ARAIDLNPRLAISWNYRGLILSALGRPDDDSVRAALTAVEIEPDSAPTVAIAANVLYHARRFDQAVACANRSIEIDPSLFIGRCLLVQLHADLGEFARAIDEGERAVAESARAPFLVSVLGYAYAKAGRAAEARRLADELLSRRQTEYIAPMYL